MTQAQTRRVALVLAAAAAVLSLGGSAVRPPVVAVAAFQTTHNLVGVTHRVALRLGEVRLREQRRLASARAARAARAAKAAKRAKRVVGVVTTPIAATAPAAQPATVVPTDPGWSQQWGLAQIGAPAAWQVSAGAKPIVIAIVDSGVDPSQPDLQGALVPGADFADSSGDTADQFGHGTEVAGVIAARPDNGIGGAGICWTCRVMPIKVLGADGSGTAQAISQGIDWATDHGANVISMSFVLSGPDQGVEDALAYAHSKGVLLIAAAGNSGSEDQTYPASYPGVVSVAAVDQSNALYSWSTRGSWVTVAAPGCSYTTVMGGSYSDFCGTSAAAPLVAGLAGLALSAGNGSAADVEAALERTAVPLPGEVGSGRVDAAALLHDQTGR